MAKTANLIVRCDESTKKEFKRNSTKLGWPDMSALLTAVVGMVNAGDLVIEPPEPQKPNVTIKEA